VKKRIVIPVISFAVGWWLWRNYDKILAAYLHAALKGLEDDPDQGHYAGTPSGFQAVSDALRALNDPQIDGDDTPPYAGVKPMTKHPLLTMLEMLSKDRLVTIAITSLGYDSEHIAMIKNHGVLANMIFTTYLRDNEDNADRIEWLIDNLTLTEVKIAAAQTDDIPAEYIRKENSKNHIARTCVIEWNKLPEELRVKA
jgi:hypothetical protein